MRKTQKLNDSQIPQEVLYFGHLQMRKTQKLNEMAQKWKWLTLMQYHTDNVYYQNNWSDSEPL